MNNKSIRSNSPISERKSHIPSGPVQSVTHSCLSHCVNIKEEMSYIPVYSISKGSVTAEVWLLIFKGTFQYRNRQKGLAPREGIYLVNATIVKYFWKYYPRA